MSLVRGDSWTIELPEGWKPPEALENGTVYLDSADESKGVYLTTWTLSPEEAPASALAAAQSFRDKEVRMLQAMEGYTWRLLDESVAEPEAGVAMVMADHLADANEYRIVTQVIARPPLVVRAAFHDYTCDDYEASRKYFAALIRSFSLVTG